MHNKTMFKGRCLVFLCTLVVVASTGSGRSQSSFGGGRAGHHSHQGMKNVGLKGFGSDDEIDPDNQLKNENFVRNAEHIKEHLKGSVDFDPERVTPEELDFHFFKIQDADGNNKLDGLELMSAIDHGLEDDYDAIDELDIEEEKKKWKRRILKNKSWIAVDRILREDDKNDDGYIAYDEFAYSRRASKELRESIV